jgi:hypothetical protein
LTYVGAGASEFVVVHIDVIHPIKTVVHAVVYRVFILHQKVTLETFLHTPPPRLVTRSLVHARHRDSRGALGVDDDGLEVDLLVAVPPERGIDNVARLVPGTLHCPRCVDAGHNIRHGIVQALLPYLYLQWCVVARRGASWCVEVHSGNNAVEITQREERKKRKEEEKTHGRTQA